MYYQLHCLMVYFGLLHTMVESGDIKMKMMLRALMNKRAVNIKNENHLPYTTMPTTPHPTPMPLTTLPPGCVDGGKTYRFGEMIQQGQSGNWCYFTMCDYSGQIVYGDNFHCYTITPTPRGCVIEGKHYQPGEQISSGQSGNWCYFTMCDYSGQIIHGDDVNCLTTLRPTTLQPTPPIIHIG